MIEIIAGHQASQHRARMAAMHQLRHKVFSQRLGWVEGSAGGIERDRFDTPDAIYILSNLGTDVVGCWRLLPTTGPTMLADVFGFLLDGRPMPTSADVWETSRFAVNIPPHLRDRARGRTVSAVTAELFAGLVEFCLLSGIENVVQVYDARIRRLLPMIGAAPEWVTPSRTMPDGTVAMAGLFKTDRAALARIRQANGLAGPVLPIFARPAAEAA